MSDAIDGGRWERVAAFEGGIVAGLAVAWDSAGCPAVFAATPVGVFRSDDAGQRWRRLGHGATLADVVLVEPSAHDATDRVMYAGSRDGLFRWDHHAEAWTHLLTGARVLSLTSRSDGSGGTILLAGTETDGVLISRNGGRTWVGANPGLLDLTVLALAASPTFSRDGIAFAATPSGLYRTRNGAASWRAVDLDEWDDVAVQCLAVSTTFATDRLVAAGTEDRGLLWSADAGRSWTTVPALDERSVTAVALDAETALVATDAGLFLSDDGGHGWRSLGSQLGPALAVASVPGAGGAGHAVILAGLPGAGLARSVDGGRTFSAANTGLHATLDVDIAVSLRPRRGGDGARRASCHSAEQAAAAMATVSSGLDAPIAGRAVYVASLTSGVRASIDDGRSWFVCEAGLPDVAIHRVVPGRGDEGRDVVFAATTAGLYQLAEIDGAWSPVLAGDATAAVVALAAAPGSRPGLLAAVSSDGRIVLSRDGGAVWQPIDGPAEGAEPLDLVLSGRPRAAGSLYLATGGTPNDAGERQLSVWHMGLDRQHWELWYAVHHRGPIRLAAASTPAGEEQLLVGLADRVLRPLRSAREVRAGRRRPIWVESDLGPGAGPIARLAVGDDGRTVYLTSGSGVWVSSDGGERFVAWSDGLDAAPMLAVTEASGAGHDDSIWGLALGGAIWRRAAPRRH